MKIKPITPQEINYLKKLYILYGRSIPEQCFWMVDDNPHEDDLFKIDVCSARWEELFYSMGFTTIKSFNCVEDFAPMPLTEKFYQFIESA